MSRRTEERRGRAKKRHANRGSFAKGPDPRRHVFTTSDCRLGYWVVMLGLTPRTQDPAVREWVRLKVCMHFAQKERKAKNDSEESSERCPAGDGGGAPPW